MKENTKEQTAMMQLIEYLEKNMKSAEHPYSRGALKIAIVKATELLPVEKKNGEDGFNEGYRNGEEDRHTDFGGKKKDISKFSNASDYFTNKYNT